MTSPASHAHLHASLVAFSSQIYGHTFQGTCYCQSSREQWRETGILSEAKVVGWSSITVAQSCHETGLL